ncbi:MAG TPA: glycerol-3-phosphate dehydrogenase [Bacteroidales bacterium]|nr:MAG: glycerol-3-phosphate dehydrogenase [Bacteroidetes bacterium GWF2_33_38]HBF88269.1 glycerol-3-phosphate dehydrogenase [Bacteroidales bacterium]
MNKKSKIAVIGEGSWATAIVKILSNNIDKINWYVRSKDAINFIKRHHHNPNFLSSVELDTSKLKLYGNAKDAILDSEIIFFVVPSAFLKVTIEGITAKDLEDKYIVSAIKGIIPEENQTVCTFFNEKYKVSKDNMAIVSGPCHAEEVALERLSYLTVASNFSENARHISNLMECRYIKTTISDDMIGSEYGTVLKNIMAVAAGICHGVGFGDNFQAVLISNAIQEMKRFIDVIHPKHRDIDSSVYLGDLLVTAYSQFSRNRTFGNMIGKGYSVKSAQLEMNMVAEGYYATQSIYEINKQYNVHMPICNAVYNILYGKISPDIEIKLLTEELR